MKATGVSSTEFFLDGIKQSCHHNIEDLTEEEFARLSAYPHHCSYGKYYTFFKTDELLSKFLRDLDGVDIGSPDYMRIMGQVLGYPPKAVEFFARNHEWRISSKELARSYFKSVKVGLHYHGIHCSSHYDDLTENCIWLWHEYSIPEPILVKVIEDPTKDPTVFQIPYRDMATATKIEEEIRGILQSDTYMSFLV